MKPSANDDPAAAAATNGPSTDQPPDSTEPVSAQKDADDAKADMELD